MTNVRAVLNAIANWIGRLLTAQILPDATARVLPVSPVPPPGRIHRPERD